MNKSQSKYFNTALRMDEALLGLLEQKDFEYITIKEICTQAGVNRSTFYLHYENTRDLLDESLTYMQNKFFTYFDSANGSFIHRLHDCSKEELFLITPEYLKPFLTFIDEHRGLYRAALENPSNFNSMEIYENMFGKIINPILDKFGVPQNERAYIMSFYLNGIAAIISQWLKDDCKMPIDNVIKLIIKCIPRSRADRR